MKTGKCERGYFIRTSAHILEINKHLANRLCVAFYYCFLCIDEIFEGIRIVTFVHNVNKTASYFQLCLDSNRRHFPLIWVVICMVWYIYIYINQGNSILFIDSCNNSILTFIGLQWYILSSWIVVVKKGLLKGFRLSNDSFLAWYFKTKTRWDDKICNF